MLYKNQSEQLSEELFSNPTSEYRGTPFWAWNTKLEVCELLEQIEHLKEMGLGGFHIHPRVGLDTKYLGPEYMETVRACNQKAKEEEMLCWLYDEDKWPSGFGGGYVTQNQEYRARFLVFTPQKYDLSRDKLDDGEYDASARVQRSTSRKFLGKYEIILKDGYLQDYRSLKEDEQPSGEGEIWWAYLEVAGDSPWFNNQSYVNTLDKEAIDKFIELTHEKYYAELGEDFGDSIPAIFTDEPQFTHKETLNFARQKKEVTLPFTDDLEESFQNTYKVSLLAHLPELIWELPEGKISTIRYRYHDHVSERFTQAFADNIGSWCEEHNIMLTGHMMEEPSLKSQTAALGETMRSYRSFQLPGIDILCDRREFSTAKQAQSAARQYDRPGVLSELYGVTNWDFDFRGHKLQGDWQAAQGVQVRVHHLTWVSMAGEAKRDYPASIGYQAPWYQEYPLIEDHFARLNTVLSRGEPQVKVGVIHPVESYWLHWGPEDQTADIREELDSNFNNLIEWLLYGLIDFDFISESLLPSLSDIETVDKLSVGAVDYEVIVVPGCETLRSSTLDRLEAFADGGGRIIFMGEKPSLVDGKPSRRAQKLAERSENIPFRRSRILTALQEIRDIDIRKKDGSRSDNLFYQMRCDGDRRWLFICHVNKMENPDISFGEEIELRIEGSWQVSIYDTLTGEISDCPVEHKNEQTVIKHYFYEHDSLLLSLEPVTAENPEKSSTEKEDKSPVSVQPGQKRPSPSAEKIDITDPVPVSLSEPNVLLLDMAEYAFDEGSWQSREEILRIDNKFRKKLGYPLRMSAMAQPWLREEKEDVEHTLALKFDIESEIEIEKPVLALENAENTRIFLNEKQVQGSPEGYFVDKSIKKVPLPAIPAGETELILKIPFNSRTDVEWCYLLGDFGVEVTGSHSKIIEPVKRLTFGDWTAQGLPFYAGNVTYHCSIECGQGELYVETPQFRNPLLTVSLDGKRKDEIALAPYRADLGAVESGEHKVDLKVYGNRINTFGTVHNCDHTYSWFGPDAWRTSGSRWSYEYQLKEMGLLISPEFILDKN